MRHRSFVTVVALAVVSITGACGGDDATHNDADVYFAQHMIPHHEQAIEMSEIALDPASEAGAEVTELATAIQAAQDPEIQQMTEWLESWDEPVAMDMSDGHDMSEMQGMMSPEEMTALDELTGAEFDETWLTMMIRHHEGAIAMAETVLEDGEDQGVADLAQAIIDGQQAEIDEMTALLDG